MSGQHPGESDDVDWEDGSDFEEKGWDEEVEEIVLVLASVE